MIPFLIVLVIVSVLIACGVFVNVYLYRNGALETSQPNSSQYSRTVPVEATTDDELFVDTHTTEDEISRYARNSVLIIAGAIVVLIILATIAFNALLH